VFCSSLVAQVAQLRLFEPKKNRDPYGLPQIFSTPNLPSTAQNTCQRRLCLRDLARIFPGPTVRDCSRINHEEGLFYIGIRFTGKTYFSLQFSPLIVTEDVEFSDMSSGDDVIICSRSVCSRLPYL